MIVEKCLKTPTFRRRYRRYELGLFSEENGKLYTEGFHVKKDGARLICAEGAYQFSMGGVSLFTSKGHGKTVFYLNGSYIRTENSGSYLLPTMNLQEIVCFHSRETGEYSYYLIASNGLYQLKGSTAVKITYGPSGACGEAHYDRLFVADGDTVYYSRPLFPEQWTEGTQSAGHIQLPSEGEDIISMCSFKDKLYLFRRKGITQLRALGDTLNFKAVAMPYACGAMFSRSVQNCGQYVCFMTKSGIYRFNGATCHRFERCGFSLIDTLRAVYTCSADGKYYASVQLKTGERCILRIDPVTEEAHFIRVSAEHIAGSSIPVFLKGANAFSLTEQGIADEPCTLKTAKTPVESGYTEYLDAVTVEGEGYFTVTARVGEKCVTVKGNAGEPLRLAKPLRGSGFSFELTSYSEDMQVNALTLWVREERA